MRTLQLLRINKNNKNELIKSKINVNVNFLKEML